MAAFKVFETASSLVIAYETLGLEHRRQWSLEGYRAQSKNEDPVDWVNYKNALAILILNASIIEGTRPATETPTVKMIFTQ